MTNVHSISDVLRRVILRSIEQCADPAERKERIMIAHGDGHLTDAQASDLIIILGLKAA